MFPQRDSVATKELLFSGHCGAPPRFRRLSGAESVATDLSLLTCSTGAVPPSASISARSLLHRQGPRSKASVNTSITTRAAPSIGSGYGRKARTPRRHARRIFRDDDDVTSEERFMLRMCAKTCGTHGMRKATSTDDVTRGDRKTTAVVKLSRRAASAVNEIARDVDESATASVSATNSEASEKRRSRAQLNRKTTMLRFRKLSAQTSEAAFSRRVGRRIRATVFALELMTGHGDSTDVVVDVIGDVGLYTRADFARTARYPQNVRIAPQLSDVIRANIRDRMGKRRVRPITVADIRSLNNECAQLGRYQRNLMIFNWLQDVDEATFTGLPEPAIVELEAVPPRVRDYPPRSPNQCGGLSHISSTTAGSDSDQDLDSEDGDNLTLGSPGEGGQMDEASMMSDR